MYVVYNIGHIHLFFNVPKKSNLVINMFGGSSSLNIYCIIKIK
jgi:hypothetical protein